MSRITLTLALAIASVFAIGQTATFPKAQKSLKAQQVESIKKAQNHDKALTVTWSETFDDSTTNTNGLPVDWAYTPTSSNTDAQWKWDSQLMRVNYQTAATDFDERVATVEVTLPANHPQLWFYLYTHSAVQTDYNGTTFNRFHIEISTDQGASWTPLFELEDVNDLIAAGLGATTDYTIPSWTWIMPRIDLSNYAGQAVKFRFVNMPATGSVGDISIYIDDVSVVEGPQYDNVVEGNYYVGMYGNGVYENQPLAEQRPFTEFFSYWFNVGYDATTNNVMHNELKDANGTVVLQKDTNAFQSGSTDLAPYGRDTFQTTALGGFDDLSQLTQGTYTYVQYVTHDGEDADTTDNYFALDIEFNDGSALARTMQHNGTASPQKWMNNADGDVMGVQIYPLNSYTLSGADIYIDDATTVDASVTLKVYTVDWTASTPTYTEVASSDAHDIVASEIGQTLTLNLTAPYTLQAETDYLVGISQNFDDASGIDNYIGAHDYNNWAMNYYSAFTINNGSLARYSNLDVPYILMHIQPTAVENVTANNNNLNVYPNPTNGTVHVDGVVAGSTVVVYNMVGAVVANIENASENNTIDLSSLEEGTYMVKVINNDQVSVKKVNLVK